MKKEGVIDKWYFLSFFLSLLDVPRTPCSLAPGTGKEVGGERSLLRAEQRKSTRKRVRSNS